MAKKVYASYRSMLGSDRWRTLAAAGTRPQRVLWASKSVKDPSLPDSYYITKLAAPDTINTVPEKTLLAFVDHGTLDSPLQPDYAVAEHLIAAVASNGIDVDALGESLQRQGTGRFSADWAALRQGVEVKMDRLRASG
jgi:transaldolase